MLYKGRYYLSANSKLKIEMLKEFHEYPIGGHAGIEHTYLRLATNVYWPGMKAAIKDFLNKCVACQAIKYSTAASYVLLHPLEFPNEFGRVWQ